ncbi:Bug family tripartite tricarboxylate transporter substrate binding protein [Roseicella aerolata]|uniref:Tripartite tricarboxylate transporter substrate binding protein n=1 Tax=Roseicella aerolata TaxID=2883479 RepID=A0A9X1LB86_9PROT|nr:tripartite tricarboxylate transporter substrate binding protein [Roseicella aerolata]MCB4822910.1 tripartite tricarboxylate transporter substrate binding protein [Roseicella aerolata]
MTLAISRRSVLLGLAAATIAGGAEARSWEPNRPVQIVVPAGTGGGADQMARVIQGIVSKHSLMRQPMVVVNKAGGAGAEGFLEAKGARGNPHMLIITLSNLFTTPLATGVPFNWKDLTPVTMMALDEFVLWVKADSPWKTAQDLIEAAKAQRLKIGGTGSKQEDQIITAAITRATGAPFTYVPFRGGGEVAVQLVGGHIDATVNNPIEAVTHWRSGALRPLCVFDEKRLTATEKMTETQAWSDIPTCKEQGLDVDYLMLRGIFMPTGVKPEQVAFYEGLMAKVRETPEWKELMQQGAFNTTSLTGDAFRGWLTREEERHRTLMQEAGFLANPS